MSGPGAGVIPTRVGLIGWPVAHSRSPAMHHAAFRAAGLHWEYLLLPVAPQHVEAAVRGLRALGFAGANVTVPHKRAVMEALDTVSAEAQIIGAVNTIVHEAGRLVGYNTDALGFVRALRAEGVEPGGQQVLLLGAGGASRAVLYALLAAGSRVTLANRSVARAQALAAEFGDLFRRPVPVVSLANARLLAAEVARATLLVNATSVGMAPASRASPLPEGILPAAGQVVYDLVYHPRQTRLLQQAAAAGARSIDGLGMLVHQGAAAWTLWTGQPAPLDAMWAAAQGTDEGSSKE